MLCGLGAGIGVPPTGAQTESRKNREEGEQDSFHLRLSIERNCSLWSINGSEIDAAQKARLGIMVKVCIVGSGGRPPRGRCPGLCPRRLPEPVLWACGIERSGVAGHHGEGLHRRIGRSDVGRPRFHLGLGNVRPPRGRCPGLCPGRLPEPVLWALVGSSGRAWVVQGVALGH